MIDAFWGEFLVSPIPMEMDLNPCNYSCSFCFANLNSPNRMANVKRIMGLLSEYPQRKTLIAQLLRNEYPIVVSNRVDVLAPSNYHVALPILQTMGALGIPVQVQSRGGKAAWVEEVLATFTKPVVWYVSISQVDDALRQKIEPGAPTIASRWALMEQLSRAGHTVVLGLNPLVREWLPDTSVLLDRARDCGAQGVWVERLHLNYSQIGNMTEREKGALTEPLIKKAQKRRPEQADQDHFDAAREYALSIGMHVYSIGQGCRSDFFTLYHHTYRKTFPTLQDFVNLCHDNDLQGHLIPFDIFADFFTPHLPQGTLPIDSYLGATAHNLWRDAKVPPQMTYRQLLSIIWGDYRIKNCPSRLKCFAWAARWDESDGKPGWILLTDKDERPYLVFSKAGFTDYYAQVDV